MTDDEAHEARMASGQAAMAILDAVQDEDVVAAMLAVGEATQSVIRALRCNGIEGGRAIGCVIGVVVAAAEDASES